ncbi:23002_t:CDS:2, partial [Dentiscutata erythropus]
LVSYLRTINNKSYRGFLELNRHIIISSISSSSLNWNDLDNLWAGRFLFEARNLYFTLDDKVNTERSQRKKDLRTFRQGVIEECGRAKRKLDIEKNKTISKFKDAIKKNARIFSNIDAKDIKLWKVEIPTIVMIS